MADVLVLGAGLNGLATAMLPDEMTGGWRDGDGTTYLVHGM